MTAPAPTFEEVFQQALDGFAARLRCIEPGEASDFDRARGTATVQPLLRDRAGEARAAIFDVPVIQPIAFMDVEDGEVGLLLIGDRDGSRWFRDGTESDPDSSATHAISNAIFLPGLRSLPGARTIPANRTVLPIPTAGGRVLIGSDTASEALVLGSSWASFMNSGLLPASVGTTVGFLKALWDFAAAAAALPGMAAPALVLQREIQHYNQEITAPGASFISDVVRTD